MATSTIKNINERFAVCTGTTGALNTEVYLTNPTGFTTQNYVVAGNTCRNSNGLWYSNNSSVTVFADSTSGIRVTATASGFANQSIKVLLVKVI